MAQASGFAGAVQHTFAASVGEALLAQFKDYAKTAVDKGDLVSDPAYEKVLHGLKVTAAQAGAAVLEQLLVWRSDTLSNVSAARNSPDSSLVLRKRLVAECLFLEAALQLISAEPACIAPQQSRDLEALAFDWILHAEKYVDVRYPELHRLRERVVLGASQLLGSLCPVALDSIVDRFLSDLGARIKADANSSSRQELYMLCSGLRFLRLHADTPAQLRAATNFLERLQPLKHVAPAKKSRLQQAITDMLTAVLASLVDEGDPSAFGIACPEELRKHWFATVSLLRTEMLRWTGKQAKQVLSGLPAAAALTCLEEDTTLFASIDGLIEQLHRQLKDKRNASMALLCLVRCVSCFLRRLSARSDPEKLTLWVVRSVTPAVQSIARGQLPAPEQQELLRQLCTTVAHHLPEYGIGSMVLELLQADSSQPWEGPMAGLLSLMSVLANVPARMAARPPLLDLPPTAAALESAVGAGAFGPWAPPTDATLQLLDIVKAGRNPLEAYAVPHLLPKVAAALGRLLSQCHQFHGYNKLTSGARPAADTAAGGGVIRERLSSLQVFVAVLQCVPYSLPDSWTTAGAGMAEDLPSYTIHAELSMRQAAVAALRRSMVALPAARDALVAGLATFVVRLPDEFPQVIKDSAALLLRTMAEWERLAATEAAVAAAAGDPGHYHLPGAEAGAFPSFARVEATGLGLLCSGDVDIRRLGLETMHAARELHRLLTPRSPGSVFAAGPYTGSYGGSGASSRRVSTSLTHVSVPEPPLLVLPPHIVARKSTGANSAVGSTAGAASSASMSGGLPQGPPSVTHNLTWHGTATPASVPSLAFAQPPPSSVADAAAAASAPSTPSSVGDGGSSILYVSDIVDRLGDALTQRCYWDFGRWSDLWREWRPLPTEGATFRDCLLHSEGGEGAVRWARILCELMREAWRRCDRAAAAAHAEVTTKLQLLLGLDSAGRQVLPHDGAKAELARAHCLLAAAAPLADSAQAGERGVASKQLIRLLVASARSGIDALQLTAVLGLGCMDASCHTLVVQEAHVLTQDYLAERGGVGGPTGRSALPMSRSGRSRREDIRLVHAHILRVLSSNLQPGALLAPGPLRDRLIEFVGDTSRHVSALADTSAEVLQLRSCLCSVARQVAAQLAEALPQAFPPMLRKQLFDRFGLSCEEGQTPGLFRSELRRSIAAAKSKLRDPDQARSLETDIADASEMVEHAAYLGMAAMLLGPLFDADAREPEGRVLTWVDRMLAAAGREAAAAVAARGLPGTIGATPREWGPPKEIAARAALRNLLRSNPELAPVFVDRCYSLSPIVAAAYFLVLADVFAVVALPLEPHVVVSLILHKVVDPRPGVRDAARGMLGTLARRCWTPDSRRASSAFASGGSPAGGLLGPAPSPAAAGGGNGFVSSEAEENVDGAVVVGSLAESHQAYQQTLSARLARDHAELSHSVALEILARHHGDVAAGAEALLCLPPWLEYASLGQQWEEQWGGALLRALYRTTSAQGIRRAYPVQKLWATLAANRRNVVPTLDFLLKQGMAESAAAAGAGAGMTPGPSSPSSACAVGKQVALYLSRVAPRHTIDHLVHEAVQQMAEVDPLVPSRQRRVPAGRGALGGEWRMIREFHQQPEMAPPQQLLLHQQPLAAHAAAAMAATTSHPSKPLTPTSIALAIKRSTLGLIIKTGVAVADTVAVAGAAAVGTISASGLTTPAGMPRPLPPPPSDRGRSARGSLDTDPAAAAYELPPLPRRRPDSPLEPPPPPPPPRTTLTRPELALCLLSEIACERDEELRPHLAPLLHVAVLHADSANQLVRLEACQLLQYLLYSLACKQLESQAAAAVGASGDYARVSSVIGYLQSLGGDPLWLREQPTLVQPWVPSAGYVAGFVQLVVDCFVFDGALRERWSGEALKWACCSASRHAASRSHQVYCALGPRLTSASCTALLAALQKCLQNATAEGLDTAVELLCTLRVVLANTPPSKLALYPHLLAACLALLNSSVVRVGELAAALLVQLLEALDLSSAAVQQALLSVLPLEEEGEQLGLVRRPSSGDLSTRGSRGRSSTSPTLPPRRPSSSAADAALWPLGQGLLGGLPDVDEDLAGGPWLALQQLIVKGLFQPDTEGLALEAMAAVAQQIGRTGAAGLLGSRPRFSALPGAGAEGSGWFTVSSLSRSLAAGRPKGAGMSGIEAIVGGAEVGLAISLAAALPWLCVHVGGGELAGSAASFLQATAGAAAAVGWRELSFVLAALAAGPPPSAPGTGLNAWLPDLIGATCRALFPAYSRLVVQRLMEAVQRGTTRYQAAALACLKAVFEVPGLDLGSPAWFAEGSRLVELLSTEVAGPLAPRVLDLMQALAAFTDDVRGAPQWGEAVQLEWRQCMDELGESNKACSEALRRVVEACPGSAELARAASAGLRPRGSPAEGGVGEQLLPFLPGHWG